MKQQGKRETSPKIFYEVADVIKPDPEPFAVLKIDTGKPREGGVEGTVMSLHMTRSEADAYAAAYAAATLREPPMKQQGKRETRELRPFDSEQYRKRTKIGVTGNECCLCGRDTSGTNGAIHVPVNHETGEFVSDEQSKVKPDACSFYPIGPECVKKWQAQFSAENVATSVRFRQGKAGLVCYDEQTDRIRRAALSGSRT